ncbi:MAG TPA: type II secretion system protein [Holophagaceae bacterium]|nr:type II secretion system protein [Holophagaceae bacterium]
MHSGPPPQAHPRTPSAQRGFTMVMLLAMIVVMGILLTMAHPTLKAQVQRENEAELIFRGEAIARALKTYNAKFGKYPQDLDELLKVRPLILRQKYKDPMVANGEWDYITQVQPGSSGETKGLPIIGVKSRCDLDGFHLYKNKSLISDWRFVADENVLGAGGDPARGGTPGGTRGGTSGEGDKPPPKDK